MGIKGSATDPEYDYFRDSFWLQAQQLRLQKDMAKQQDQMQGQSKDEQGQEDGTGEPNTGSAHREQALQQGMNNGVARQEDQSQDVADQNLSQIADRAAKMLKSEKLSSKDRALLQKQQAVVDQMKAAWALERARVQEEIQAQLLALAKK